MFDRVIVFEKEKAQGLLRVPGLIFPVVRLVLTCRKRFFTRAVSFFAV
ncbi:hypothetical protein THTE_1599 [Thermogutta terrifontis]|uniref:Uncharacterized protein n=1 Tax=Thermogutta terrifontis TaxID=1331910 RepID=A0A286RE12_9BACT|nr:hypothetical protein THTE_1599 [Thermogutta terrifontis]